MRALLIALACLTALAAARAVPPEFRAYLRSQADPLAFYVYPDAELAVPQRSVEAVYGGLIACDDAFAAPGLVFMPTEAISGVLTSCRTLAERLLDRAPSLSLAHLVHAQALARQGDGDAAWTALAAAEATGGDITWMAERRFDLLVGPYLPRRAETEAALAREIVRLAQSRSGRTSLASRYRAHPELREAIETAVSTLSPEIQRQFLEQVRAMGS